MKTNNEIDDKYMCGYTSAMKVVKDEMLKMIVVNEREMTNHKNLASIFYYSDIDNTLKMVYRKLFYCGNTDTETTRQICNDVESFKKDLEKQLKPKPASKKIKKEKTK